MWSALPGFIVVVTMFAGFFTMVYELFPICTVEQMHIGRWLFGIIIVIGLMVQGSLKLGK